MTARQRFVSSMLAWLDARLVPPGVQVTATTPLFASGLISSIKVLELIAYTERAIGRTIADKDIRLDNFCTVERIAEAFVRGEDHAAA